MRTLHALLALLSLTSPALAHDYWIEPGRYRSEELGVLPVRLRVGDFGVGDEVARVEERQVRFGWIDAEGERAIPGRDYGMPAGYLRPRLAGLQTLAFVSTPAALELPAAKFEAYLAEEGLGAVSRWRAEHGEAEAVGREAYSRSAKSLVRLGSPERPGVDRPVGLPLEFVAQADPYALAPEDGRYGPLSVRLLWQGAAEVGAQVKLIRLDAERFGPEEVRRLTTDAQGDLTLAPLAAGRYLLSAVHMQRAAADATDHDWRSTWGSLTFAVGPQARGE